MKRIIALLLSAVLLFAGCGRSQPGVTETSGNSAGTSETTSGTIDLEDALSRYTALDDKQLLTYVENLVYRDTVLSLNSAEYFVENVSAVYISKEYLDEVAFNSKANIYFGYTLDDLDGIFKGTKYIFTLSDSGNTTVQELQEIKDVSTETMLKNVAIGTGVILVCVTVSIVSAGAGAPAVSMIFAASAEGAKTFAVSSAVLGGISAGIVRGIQTGDLNEALQTAAMSATEGFKWGAVSGAIVGGGHEAFLLKSATKSGLTMNEAAVIQAESNLPVDVISQLHSMDEYLIYKNAGLKTMMINGRTVLVPDIDWNYVSMLPDGTTVTNYDRMMRKLPPIDHATGNAYEVHHVGQNNDGVLAILTREQHRGEGSFSKLHWLWKDSKVDHGSGWKKTTSDLWKSLGNLYSQGGA